MSILNLFDLKKSNLNFFGWTSIIYGVLSIPMTVIALIAVFSNPQMQEPNPLGSLLTIALSFLYAGIFFYFKVLLNKKYKFKKANSILSIFIYTNILATVIYEVLRYVPGADGVNMVVPFIGLFIIGIESIALGVKLLSLENNLFGLKKSVAINLIVFGALSTSLIFFLLALIPSAIMSVLMGIIFLREASADKAS